MTYVPLLAACLVLLAAMGPVPAAAQDHGHDHGPGEAAHADEAAHAGEAEAPPVAVTLWTDEVELFMEYPQMVAARSGRFIIHLTVLDGFQPVRAGRVVLTFTAPDGRREVRTADTLLREGIFAPDIGLVAAGPYAFELAYEGPDVSATFTVPGFRVHAAPVHAHEDEEEEGITFLKEQQWQVPFATAFAEDRELKRTVWAIGRVLPAPQAYAEIAAPIAGTVQVLADGDLALPGAHVRRGDVVARIAPPLEGDSWTASRLALAQAERDYARAQRLREVDAIPAREFEAAENAYLALKAGHAQLAGAGDGDVLT
ncbi:MAG: hypothetical protein ABR506_10370, partial [Candidatus Krumholzibacteriia bacterium]